MDRDHESPLAGRFRAFSAITRHESPLYAEICAFVARDDDLLGLVADAPPTQPIPNLLLGAVHQLLLDGAAHPLADHYPSVGGHLPADGAGPAFKAFAMQHRDHITDVAMTRRVQTNEVGRCVAWVLATALEGSRIEIIEVGASLGLNLNFDRYGYSFDGTPLGAAHARLVLPTRLDGPAPIPSAIPAVTWRRGIDVHPVDVARPDQVSWTRALLWPEQLDRLARFDSAVQVTRAHPVEIVAGDALELLESVVEAAPGDSPLVVFHSFVLNQASAESRRSFDSLFDALGRRRPLTRLSFEWLRPDDGPMLDMTVHRGSGRVVRRLAAVHHHGAWIRWIDRGTPRGPKAL